MRLITAEGRLLGNVTGGKVEVEGGCFFSMFEREANARRWADEEQKLMLQFTGKAQEIYSSTSAEDCKSYKTVKTIMLKVLYGLWRVTRKFYYPIKRLWFHAHICEE